eukprot:TRINITY_DN3731_c0_g1_i1.p1 TRINITY_DN3731_c0_g1~~TRINITY_DN3731_c0_g1_i1.p1  ORF type:complete len:1471 (-),score=432.14 TRINITY_DN3731_c0_g1_i1:79-4491(-)
MIRSDFRIVLLALSLSACFLISESTTVEIYGNPLNATSVKEMFTIDGADYVVTLEDGYYEESITLDPSNCKSLTVRSLGVVYLYYAQILVESQCNVTFDNFYLGEDSYPPFSIYDIYILQIYAPFFTFTHSYIGGNTYYEPLGVYGPMYAEYSQFYAPASVEASTFYKCDFIYYGQILAYNQTTIMNCNFDTLQETWSFIAKSNTASEFYDCHFKGDSSIQIDSQTYGVSLEFTNCTFDYSQTPPIYTGQDNRGYSSAVTMTNCVMKGGLSSAMVLSGLVILRETNISNYLDSGVWFPVDGTLQAYNSTFSSINYGVLYGGSQVEVVNCRFLSNYGPVPILYLLQSESLNFTIKNSYFFNNTEGNIMPIATTSKMIVEGSTFDSNVASAGPAINLKFKVDLLRIVNCTFIDNVSQGDGGSILLHESFEAKDGIIQNSTFVNNIAKGNGGAFNIELKNSKISIGGLRMYGNTAFGSGGAGFISGPSLKIADVIMQDNDAQLGSGLYLEISDNGNLIVDRVNAVGGLSELLGGPILITGQITSFNLTDSTFSSGDGGFQGGAVTFLGSARVQNALIHNANFSYNLASKGGHISSTGIIDKFTVQNCTFSQGSAGEGSGIYFDASKYKSFRTQLPVVTLKNLKINDHLTDLVGSIVDVVGSVESVTLSNIQASGNRGVQGGFLRVTDSKYLDISASNLTFNYASQLGGAIFVSMGESASFRLDNLILSSNSALESGGSLHLFSTVKNQTDVFPTFLASNSLISNGKAKEGSAFSFTGAFASITLRNLNVRNNEANGGSAVFFNSLRSETVQISNSNFTNNSGGEGGCIKVDVSSRIIQYFNVSQVVFDSNSVSGNGGAVSIKSQSTPFYFLGCNFRNNSGNNAGAFFSDSVNQIIINSSSFSLNNANKGIGGSIFISNQKQTKRQQNDQQPQILSSSFSSNSASSGGAIGVSGNVLVSSASFNGNTGGDVVVLSNSKLTLVGSGSASVKLESANSTLLSDSSAIVSCSPPYVSNTTLGSTECVLPLPSPSNSTSLAASPSQAIIINSAAADNSTNVGVIVGVVVGCLVFTIVLAVVLIVVFRKKQQDERRRRMKFSVELENLWKDLILPEVQVGETIGSGHFGDVYRGFWNGTVVALKSTKTGSDDKDVKWAEEIKLLQGLNHPNVVRLLGLHKVDDNFYMVLEYMEKGSLDRYLQRNAYEIQPDDLLIMCFDLCKGMKYIQQKGIIHRDLAARNLLVDASKRIKISDFGMSKQEDAYEIKSDTIPFRWSAPEVITEHVSRPESDVWSFGICVWEIYCGGQVPYSEMSNAEVVKFVLAGNRLTVPEACPEFLGIIMKNCWQHSPEHRPTFGDIYSRILEENHPALALAKLAERESISSSGGSPNSKRKVTGPKSTSGGSAGGSPKDAYTSVQPSSVASDNLYSFSDVSEASSPNSRKNTGVRNHTLVNTSMYSTEESPSATEEVQIKIEEKKV